MKTEDMAALLVAAFKGEVALDDEQVKGLKPAVAEFVGFVNGTVDVSPVFDKMTEDPNSAAAVNILSNLAQAKDGMERGTIVAATDSKIKKNATVLFEIKEPAPVAKPPSKPVVDPSVPPPPPSGLLDSIGVAADTTTKTGDAGEEAIVAEDRKVDDHRDRDKKRERGGGSDKHSVDVVALTLAMQSTNERAVADARAEEAKAKTGIVQARVEEANATAALVAAEELAAERAHHRHEGAKREKAARAVLEARGSGSTATKDDPAPYTDPRKARASVPAAVVEKEIPLWIKACVGTGCMGVVLFILVMCSGVMTGGVVLLGAP